MPKTKKAPALVGSRAVDSCDDRVFRELYHIPYPRIRGYIVEIDSRECAFVHIMCPPADIEKIN